MTRRELSYSITVATLLFPLLGFVIISGNKLNVRYKDMGYDKPGLFLYRVTETNARGKLIHTDTLGLYCSAGLNGQNHMQWQIMCRRNGELVPDEKSYDGSYTINDITDSIFFIHPPRSDRYRILQFCPYPYFSNGTANGTWTWDFAVGSYWATPPTYPIKKVDTFHISYSGQAEKKVMTIHGELMAHGVIAVSKSKYGTATSEFALHEKYGIVSWTAIPANGHVYSFILLKHLAGTDAIASNRQFAYSNAERERAIERRSTKQAMKYLGMGK